MLSLPNIETLQPQLVDGVYRFDSENTQLVKLDLLFEAGSAYQPKKLCASAAAKLLTVATPTMDSSVLAEFMDYRGILVETDSQVLQSSVTFYFLRRFADELLPVVTSMLGKPSFSESDFETWRKKRRQEILAAEQKTATIARRNFYLNLFGDDHPLGRYATAADLDRLSVEDVREYIRRRYTTANMTVVVAGAPIDTAVLRTSPTVVDYRLSIPATTHPQSQKITEHLATATQTSIRVGRSLPLAWDSPDYARLMLLTTLLGGYFGSRLMGNLREDKGYTYGIYARTQIYRGMIVFYITADVAGGTSDAAEREVMHELERLVDNPVPEEELELVKTVMAGDFLRSVDGIFERSARFCDMYATCVTERLTENLRDALQSATPRQLQELAEKYLRPVDMVVSTAGV